MTTPLNLPAPGAPPRTWAGPLNGDITKIRDRADAAHRLSRTPVTADYTVDATTGDIVDVMGSSPVTVTFPNDLDRAIEVRQRGTGQATVATVVGVGKYAAPPSTGFKTPGRRGSVLGVYCPGTVVTDPPSVNRALRIRADDVTGSNGASVSAVPDSSGQGHPDATCTGVTLVTNSGGTGHKGLSFNGSSSVMTLSGTALDIARNRGALTVFMALVLPATVSGARTLLALSTGTSTSATRVLLGHRDSVAGLPVAGGRRQDADSLVSITGTALAGGTSTPIGLKACYRWSASDLLLFQGGDQTASTATFQTDGVTSDTRSQAGKIGANSDGAGGFARMELLELLAFWSADLDGSLAESVDSYFAQTYQGIVLSDALAASEWIFSGGVA